MKPRLLLLAAGLLLAGCATSPSPPAPPPPPHIAAHDEFAWSKALGANVIQGRGVWRGDARRYSCAGQSAALIPETPYTRRRMVQLYGSDQKARRSIDQVKAISAGDPGRNYGAYVRNTQCGPEGRFEFRDLPDGAWFVIAHGVARDGASEVALQRVDVFGGAVRSVSLGGG
jgi:hypothetical protein